MFITRCNPWESSMYLYAGISGIFPIYMEHTAYTYNTIVNRDIRSGVCVTTYGEHFRGLL